MRLARAEDHWRRLTLNGSARHVRLQTIEFEQVIGLGEGALRLHPSFTVICGANGAGKSTLLGLVRLVIAFERTPQSSRSRHLGANAVLTVEKGHAETEHVSYAWQRGQSVLADTSPLSLYISDPSADWFRIKGFIERQANWSEVLQPLEGRTLKESELRELSYLCGKTYSQCEVFEIDGFGDGDEVFPYFKTSVGTVTYGFEEMGAGEGALCLMWWMLGQIQDPGVIVIEEPETHITSKSQCNFLNLVAKKCVKQVSCIITTHSPDIIAHVPRECVRLVVRQDQSIRVVERPSDVELSAILGMHVAVELFVIVEDRVSRLFVRELIRVLRPEILGRIAVADAGDVADVMAVSKSFPVGEGCPLVVGVMDGEQFVKYSDAKREKANRIDKVRHPVVFLPGTSGPDSYLRHAGATDVSRLAAALNANTEFVRTALTAVEGNDPHDWLENLAKILSVQVDRIVGSLVEVALSVPDSRQECDQVVAAIEGVLGGELVAASI